MTGPLNLVPSFLATVDAEPLCAEVDPDLHFPEKGGSTRAAKALCRRCELEEECLAWALATREPHGVWGGMSENQRRRIIGQRPGLRTGARDINHGTEGGYKAHHRRGIPVPADDACGCREASRRAAAARKERAA